jgi:hypothetical protein
MTKPINYSTTDKNSIYTLLAILALWVIQVHCLFQIIINRVSILMMNRKRAKQLKIGVAAGIVVLNITVFCIWIPAKLEVNQTFVKLNVVWVRKLKVQIQRASLTSFDQPRWDDVQDAISTVLNLICKLARFTSAILILPRDPANCAFTSRTGSRKSSSSLSMPG